MPVPWVNGVTPVDAPNLEIMEADIVQVQTNLNAHAAAADPHPVYAQDSDLTAHVAAADPHTGYQKETEKAVANGYAPLDAGAKVPLVHLPPVSGVDYIGDWGAPTAYKKGDVVRYLGNDYMAVNDSTGVTPPAAAVSPAGVVGMGTTLPASPFNGQEFNLVDAVTNPQWLWRLRYNASSISAYKWEFVGGSALNAYIAVQQAHPGGAIWADLATVGPQFTAPFSGDYWFEVDLTMHGAGSDAALVGVTDNGATPNPPTYRAMGSDRVNDANTFAYSEARTLTAGWVPRMRYLCYIASGFSARRLRVTPIRIAG